MLGTRENRKAQKKKKLYSSDRTSWKFLKLFLVTENYGKCNFQNAVSFEWILSFIYHH